MEKTFTLTVKIDPNDTPQNWIFSKDISGIEQLAIWVIVKNLSEQQIKEMLEKR